jgi:hypothetical protein
MEKVMPEELETTEWIANDCAELAASSAFLPLTIPNLMAVAA